MPKIILLFLTASLAAPLAAQEKPAKGAGKQAPAQVITSPLLDQAFEQNEGGWTTMGTNAAVHITRAPADIKNGKGALALSYEVAPRQVGMAVLPNIQGALANISALRFWLRTDAATGVAVLLSEAKPGGGDYTAVVWSPKGVWQHIELTPADFAVNQGPNDPKDADGKLDMDQVQAIGILDLASLFAGATDNDVPIVVDKRSGKHMLWIDDFQAVPGASPKQPVPATASLLPPLQIVIDDFRRDFVAWMTPGGAELSLSASGNPVKARALEARYQQTPNGIVALVRSLGHLDLRGTAGIEFDIASVEPAQVIIGVEEKKPGAVKPARYTWLMQLPGNREVVHESIIFADMQPEGQATAPPGSPDPALLKMFSIADLTGVAAAGSSQQNTLWIANILAR